MMTHQGQGLGHPIMLLGWWAATQAAGAARLDSHVHMVKHDIIITYMLDSHVHPQHHDESS